MHFSNLSTYIKGEYKMKVKKHLTICLFICFILATVASVFFYMPKTKEVKAVNTIPVSYQNDYRNLSYVTGIKNQQSTGMCWAFAAVACAEADAIKNHGANKNEIDLSEWHLAYFLYNGERVGTGDNVTYPNTETPYYKIGGNDGYTVMALSNWIGFASESVAPFSTLINNFDATIDSNKMYECNYKLENLYMYDVATEQDLMKQAIMDYGAITLSYNQSEEKLNTLTYAQYSSEQTGANHLVTVVGWDDNYAISNFRYGERPSSNGAWLVRNSWGDWGLDGYFWLSYEDKTITSASAIDVAPATKFDNNYQHDGGISPSMVGNTSTTKFANVFTANSKEILTAVGVMTYGLKTDEFANDLPYTVRIYKNPSTLNTSSFSFSWGTPVLEQSGVFSSVGFATINLTTQVYLEQDDVFVVEIETSAYIGVDFTHQVQAQTNSGVVTLANSEVSVQKGQSYVINGGQWKDIKDLYTAGLSNREYNLRIKAFTLNTQVGETIIEIAPSMRATLYYGEKLTDDLLYGGKVIDNDTKAVLEGTWTFKDKEELAKSGDLIKVIFTPKDVRYQAVETTIYASILQVKPVIMMGAIQSTAYLGTNVPLSATVKNPYNQQLTDLGSVSFYYQIDGGVKNKIIGNTFYIPNGVLDGSVITFSAEYSGDGVKYLDADVVTASVTVQNKYRISETPTVTNVYFGQTLSSSVLSGGKVLDTSTGLEVTGEWRFDNVNYMPSGDDNCQLNFYESNAISPLLSTVVNINSLADTPNVKVYTDKSAYDVGDKIDVTVVITNKYNESVKDFGKCTLYYIIGDSDEMTKIPEKGLTVTESLKGKNIKIVAVVEGVTGKYQGVTKSQTVNVLYGNFASCSLSQSAPLTMGLILIPTIFIVICKIKKNKEQK